MNFLEAAVGALWLYAVPARLYDEFRAPRRDTL